MDTKMDILDDDFFDDELLFNADTITDLNDDDDFIDDSRATELNDEEFDQILKDLVDNNDESLTISEERKLLAIEKELTLERIRIEREELENEKAKFERSKKEWEALKKLSEESFQAEKEEFERFCQLEKEKRNLETKELMTKCVTFNDFLVNYQNIPDVSK